MDVSLYRFMRGSASRTPSRPRGRGRSYDAGASGRLTSKWPSVPVDADEIIRRNLRPLVARSRQQVANNDYARRFVQMVQDNVIGSQGAILQVQAKRRDGRLDMRLNDAVEWAWWEWGRRGNCDVTGRLSWLAIQRLFVATVAKDGEAVAILRYGDTAGPWGFALQLVDPQRIPVEYDEERLPNGNIVRHGIEMTSYGRPVAYYFRTDDERAGYVRWTGHRYIRIPASQVVHAFVPEIVGQKRGIPWMSTALLRLHMIGGYEDAALVNARVSAAKMGWLKPDKESAGYAGDGEGDEIAIDAEPGTYEPIPDGYSDVIYPDYQYPNGEFGTFVKSCLRGVSAGLNVSYNTLASDLEGVNYSSLRQGALEEREVWKGLQGWIIEELHQRVYEAWLTPTLLQGRIVVRGRPVLPIEEGRLRCATEWQPRRWAWVDPIKDMSAKEKEMKSLLRSPGEIIRELGRDPEDVWREIAGDVEAMKAAGIPDDMIRRIFQGGGEKGASKAEDSGSDEGTEQQKAKADGKS